MKNKIKISVATLLCCLGAVTTVSAVQVTKSFRYDFNVIMNVRMNYHNQQYINIPNWSRYAGRSEYRVGGDWNYARYEVLNYYTGGY